MHTPLKYFCRVIQHFFFTGLVAALAWPAVIYTAVQVCFYSHATALCMTCQCSNVTAANIYFKILFSQAAVTNYKGLWFAETKSLLSIAGLVTASNTLLHGSILVGISVTKQLSAMPACLSDIRKAKYSVSLHTNIT